MKKVDKLNPFGRFCVSIGAIPSSYMESLSYDEQLMWFCNFLEKQVIPAVNNNADAVIELQNYVKNYFDNLDVQEEINTKLDEMAESGELTEIIAQYLTLAGVLAYNSINDMAGAENLIEGSICYTLGQTTYNDGKGAFYKIRTMINTDVADGFNLVALTNYNTLIAERITNYYINEINDNIDLINSDITVCIGDSYAEGVGTDNPTKGWPAYLKDIMNLNNNEFYNICEGGSGLVQTGGSGHTFLTLLQANIDNIHNKNKVKNVIICGGYNDYNQDDSDINDAIETLINYIKIQFPNAKIYFGMVARSTAKSDEGYNRRKFYNTNLLRCYQNCMKYGALYLNGVENILHEGLFMTDDTVHPNALGYEYLASGIFNALKTGSIDYCGVAPSNSTFTDNDVFSNPNDLHIFGHIKGDNTQIFCTSDFLYFTNPTNINGGDNLHIGKLNNEQFIPNVELSIPVMCYIATSDSKFYSSYALLNFANNGDTAIKFNIFANDGTGWLTINNASYIKIMQITNVNIQNTYC